MAYTDIITLEDAKTYLRIDDDLIEDDNQIIRMIKASLSYVEKSTNYVFEAQDKEYRLIDGCVRVYDYPINSEVTADLVVENKTLYTNYTLGYENDLITLNVGYVDTDNIPAELLEVAFELIESFYYEKETNKSIQSRVSAISQLILNQYKRFIV